VNQKKVFDSEGTPRKVAIIFLGDHRREKIKSSNIQKSDFHKFACAHLLVQMNSAQNLFVFQVLFWEGEDGFQLPKEDENKDGLGSSFCKGITEFMKGNQEKDWEETDYWIGITSREPKEIFGETARNITTPHLHSDRYIYTVKSDVHIITSKDWEKKYCPPSLFEYLVLAVFICCGRSLIQDLVNKLTESGKSIPPDPHDSLGMTGC